MSKKPDYRVCVSEKNGDDNFFTDVGAGWSFKSEKAEGVSVKLRPNLAVSGELVLFKTED